MTHPGTMLIKQLKPNEAFKLSDPSLFFIRAINHLPYTLEIRVLVLAEQK